MSRRQDSSRRRRLLFARPNSEMLLKHICLTSLVLSGVEVSAAKALLLGAAR